MNSDLSARLGALLLSVLLLCGLFSGCNAQPAASSGEAYPVSPPAAALSEAPAKVTEPPGFPSSETPPDAASSPATGAAEPEPPPAEPSPAGQPARPTTLTVRTPAAPGKDKSEGGGAVIDYSNRSEGYVMVKYSGGASRVKIQITGPDKTTYTYDSSKNGFEAFPLTAGNGGYTVNVYTEIHSSQYALAQGASFQATQADFCPTSIRASTSAIPPAARRSPKARSWLPPPPPSSKWWAASITMSSAM